MFKKSNKEIAKRILALLMSLLMVWSLIPANAYPVWADPISYTFTITEAVGEGETNPATAVTEATIKVYTIEEDGGSYQLKNEVDSTVTQGTVENTEDKNGIYTVTVTSELNDTHVFVIECEGYEAQQIKATDIVEKAHNVTMVASTESATSITLSGVVTGLNSVSVTVESIFSNEIGTTTTENNSEDPAVAGHYSITSDVLKVGNTYKITYSYTDYITQIKYVTLADEDNDNQISLDEVTLVEKTSLDGVFKFTHPTIITGISTDLDNPISISNPLVGFSAVVNPQFTKPIVTAGADLLSDIDLDQNGNLTFKVGNTTGEVKIQVGIEASENTKAATAEVVVKVVDGDTIGFVDKNNQESDEVVEEVNKDYSTGLTIQYGPNIEGINFEYKSDNEDVATVAEDGKVTILKATVGEEVVTITATSTDAVGADGNPIVLSYKLKINPITQILSWPEYGWTVEPGDNVIPQVKVDYSVGGKVQIVPTSNIKDGAGDEITPGFTYALEGENAEDIASIENNGIVHFLKAGTVTVVITAAGNAWYTAVEEGSALKYELVINGLEDTIAFPEENTSATIVLGQVPDLPILGDNGYGNGTITYALAENSNQNILKVESDGTIALADDLELITEAVTLEIIATKASDGIYNSATATYTITVNPWDISEITDLYEISKDDILVENGEWHSTNGIIITAGAEYIVAKTLSELLNKGEIDKGTAITLECNADTDNYTETIYVKSADGKIAEVILSSLKVDTTAPVIDGIVIGEKNVIYRVAKALEDILAFFGFDQDNYEEITITASDATSGVANIYYYIDTLDDATNPSDIAPMSKENLEAKELELKNDHNIEMWTVYNAEENPQIVDDGYKVVYAKVVDNAGHITYHSTKGVVFDGTAPTIGVNVNADMDVVPNGTVLDYTNKPLNSDVTVNLNITDAAPYSGLNSVYYIIYPNGKSNPEGVTESVEIYDPQQNKSDLTATWTGSITVPIVTYSSNPNLTVVITAVDKAGNSSTMDVLLNTCKETPTINVSVGNTSLPNAGTGFFEGGATATITITSREDVVQILDNLISITDGTDPVEASKYTVSEWISVENTHTATVTFNTDGNYKLAIQYEDKAGNSATYASGVFAVDGEAPTAEVTIGDKLIDVILNVITFGLYKSTSKEITVNFEDGLSGVSAEGKQYYLQEVDLLNPSNIVAKEEVLAWEIYIDKISIDDNKSYVLYVKVTDNSGNSKIYDTYSVVNDDKPGEITLTPDTSTFYNKDAEVELSISETLTAIQKVEFWVGEEATATIKGTVYELPTHDDGSPYEISELKRSLEDVITIPSQGKDGQNLILHIRVTDIVGNISEKTVELKFDITAPRVEISYDNNNVFGDKYFTQNRTATIKITDLNLDASATKILVNGNNVIGTGICTYIDDEVASGIYKYKVEFTEDGAYTLAVSCKDLAGSVNDPVTYVEGTTAGASFVIDKEGSKINISYENNTPADIVSGKNYFGANRVLKVEITENPHVFNSAKATAGIQITAKDKNGAAITVNPTFSAWTESSTENGEKKYTAKVTLHQDGYYEVNVYYVNEAGLSNQDVEYVNGTVYPDAFVIDKTAPTLVVNPTVNKDLYKEDVTFNISVNDLITTTGINSVKYWITKDNVKGTEQILFTYDSTTEQTFTDSIIVVGNDNNSCNVKLTVEVTDNVGHVSSYEKELDIDMEPPKIDVEFTTNNNPVKVVGTHGYYTSNRVAIVTVTERGHHFNSADFKAKLEESFITAKDANGDKVNGTFSVEYNGTTNNVHKYTIRFNGDANYTFNTSYTDKAGWSNTPVNYLGSTTTPNSFTIDATMPTASIKVGEWTAWEKLLNVITFGLWTPNKVDIVITSNDATSPLETVQYYKTNIFTPMSVEQLNALSADKWTDYQKFSVASDDIFVIYVKVTDYAGHTTYISTNGIIVDSTKPVFETLKPEVTITPEQPINGIYSGNVKVDVNVVDPRDPETDAYAGLNEIRYEIYNMGAKTQEGVLFDFNVDNPLHNELVQLWDTNNSSNIGYGKEIVVDAALNNSNDVVIKLIATDNAGNQTESTASIKIDTVKPVIDITYNNNTGDTTFTDGVYFQNDRVATIVVTERNFDSSKVNIKITNTDGVIPTISEWTSVAGTGNGDDTTYTAQLVYNADGDYSFAISYTDDAGHEATDIDYHGALAPNAFTIDKTAPIIEVSYNNNEALNGNYFKADRFGTITITEHNFDPSRVTITIAATDNGNPIEAPVIGGWSTVGDAHTATISYATDALYTFDIAYIDKAGNAAADFAEQSFYVDKTAPILSISGIVNESANNKDVIGFVISASDTNFDIFTPVLSAVVKTENGFATEELSVGSIADITNGQVYTVGNIDADGIYRITCTLVDKAGNAYTHVVLENAEGGTYSEALTAEDTLVNFSINREGSTFEVDENTSEVIENFYVGNVKNDITIVEVNTDALASYEVTLNGKVLVEGTDYTVETTGGNGVWMRYRYILKSALFMAEGEYTIVVASTDKAENNAYSDVKNTKVSFVVDRTAPVVTITGMQNNGRYQADEAQLVTLIPSDDGGTLASLSVIIRNAAGELKWENTWSGEDLITALEQGAITFEIPTDTAAQTVEVICTDSAVNENGEPNTYSETFTVTVASSELALLLADESFRFAVLGGGVAVVAGIAALVVFLIKRKQKRDKTIIRQ